MVNLSCPFYLPWYDKGKSWIWGGTMREQKQFLFRFSQVVFLMVVGGTKCGCHPLRNDVLILFLTSQKVYLISQDYFFPIFMYSLQFIQIIKNLWISKCWRKFLSTLASTPNLKTHISLTKFNCQTLPSSSVDVDIVVWTRLMIHEWWEIKSLFLVRKWKCSIAQKSSNHSHG